MRVTVTDELVIMEKCPQCGEVEAIQIKETRIEYKGTSAKSKDTLTCHRCDVTWESGVYIIHGLKNRLDNPTDDIPF